MVTASYDKTLRVWELSTGRPLRVIRPPMGEGNEGRLDAVALSPDGRTLACGGWTGSWDKEGHIYLFNLRTGAFLRRLTGLHNVISHLAFSRDGKFLAATLGGKNGVRIFRTGDWGLQAEDRDYGDTSYWAEFDALGRLATTSRDGFIRLYGRGFKLLSKKQAPGGSRPASVAFSPSSDLNEIRLAVGFVDSTRVDVLSGQDLTYLYSPDTTGVSNGSLNVVAWSKDGKDIYTGGSYNVGGEFPIFKWTDMGKGQRSALKGPHNTLMHILPLKDGSLAFVASDPAWGVLDREGRSKYVHGPAIADYRNNLDGFLTNLEGSKVRFGYEVREKGTADISVQNRSLSLDPDQDPLLSSPLTSSPYMEVTDWKDREHLKLKGKELKLFPYDRIQSLAISPDQSAFLLGTLYRLMFLNQGGRILWYVRTPGAAWAVNLSGNGKIALAALGDGTIRWYRI